MFKTDNAMNNNVFIYGDVGAGKTNLIIEEIKTYLKNKENKLYIIDLYGEYKSLAEEYNGEIINLSQASKNKVNPFYISDKKDNEIFENEILYDKIEYLIYLFYNDFSHIELNYIKVWLVEIYNRNEEITFSHLLDSINQFKTKTEINGDKILLTKWEYTTMQYINTYLDCKNNIDISTINKSLVIFDLSHINKREKSIVTYSALYLIWEELMLNDELYKSRILIDNIELLDEGVNYYLNYIMKRSRVNNCGVILSTNNYEKSTDNDVKKLNCLNLSGTQLIMRVRNSEIELIKYDMNLSIHEIYQLENLSVGEYIKFPQLRESESQYEKNEKKYSYFISYYFEKKRLFKMKKDFEVGNIVLDTDYKIRSYDDILKTKEKIKTMNGLSKIKILNYELMNNEYF